jgi:branched-chain amino acid transport system permease protein
VIENRLFRLGAGTIALLGAAALPLFLRWDLEFSGRMALAVIWAFAVLSVIVLTGYVGQVSLCQGTFVGVSAFATASLVNHGANYFLAGATGVVLAFALGVAVGIPALRLQGILLAVTTAGVALAFDYFFYQDDFFSWFNGGKSGWRVSEAQFFGINIGNGTPEDLQHIYWILLGLFAVAAVLVVNLHDSGSGRRFRAIRDSELAAATMGVDLTKYKLLAFGLSAAIAGIGGAFFPLVQGSTDYYSFSFFYSLQFAAIGVLMGIRYVPAAALGGFFIAVSPWFLARISDGLTGLLHREVSIPGVWFNLALGALLVVQMITYPEGVWGDLAHRFSHLFGRYARAPGVLATTEIPAET